MEFFESLNETLKDNSGLFMLGGLMSASSIANSQRQMAHAAREASEAEQNDRNEMLRLQRESLEEERRERTECKLAAEQLKRFRSLLSYCQILQEQPDQHGFVSAAVEIFAISLENLLEACNPDSEDLHRYQRFQFAREQTAASVLQSVGTGGIQAAVQTLQTSIESLKSLEDIFTEARVTNRSCAESCFDSVSNRDLLSVALSFAGAPFDLFALDEARRESKKRLTDRNGILRCSTEDWSHLSAQICRWSNEKSSTIQGYRNDFRSRLQNWVDQHPMFQLQQMEANSGKLLSSRPLRDSPMVDQLFMEPSAHLLLNILERKKGMAVEDQPEFKGFQAIPEAAVRVYDLLIVQIQMIKQSVIEFGKIDALWIALSRGELHQGVEVGIDRLLHSNSTTAAKLEAANQAERARRIAGIRQRNGRTKTPFLPKEKMHNPRFDYVRKMRHAETQNASFEPTTTSIPTTANSTLIRLDEQITKTQPREVSPADAYINALCAMAVCDGCLCTEEKWTVNKWVAEARLDIPPLAAKGVIDHWSELVEDPNLQSFIAQSIVDCHVLAKTQLAEKLILGLSAVLRSDNKISSSEKELFQLIQAQLQIRPE